MSVIGTNLKNARIKRNLSIKEVAKKAGVTELLLNDIESGKKIPNTQLINTVTKILGVSIDAIEPSYFSSYFEEEENEPKKAPEPKYISSREKTSDVGISSVSDALSKAIKKLPVLNKVTPGKPIPCESDIVDYKFEPAFSNKSSNIKGEEFLYFIAQDNSMIGSRIVKNDLCLVFQTDTILDRDIVLAVLDGKTLLRRYKSIDGGKVLLYPDNPEYEVIFADKKAVSIIGKIVRVEFRIK